MFSGTGTEPNKAGVEYYRKLIKLLLANKIQPVVTLHHFDSPMGIEKQGGFFNKLFPGWFANYSRICFREFGDDVKFWSTFNEPINVCGGSTAEKPYICAHQIIKAHAAAWHVYDKEFRKSQKGEIERKNKPYCVIWSPSNLMLNLNKYVQSSPYF